MGGYLFGFLTLIFGIVACGHDSFELGRVCAAGALRACYSGPKGTEGVGRCAPGEQACLPDESGWGPCEGEVTPQPETCAPPVDGGSEDEDCDGKINEEGEGCACVPGTMEACYGGPKGTEGVGICAAGAHSCLPDGTWGKCLGEVLPDVEDCASPEDEDCDGVVCGGPLWGELFGNADAQTVGAIVSDAEGNAILAGGFAGSITFGSSTFLAKGSTDIYVAKLDTKGKKLWARALGGTAAEAATAAAVDDNGDVLVVGSFASDDLPLGLGAPADVDAFVVKLHGDDGTVDWALKLGESGNGSAASIAVDKNGNAYVGGGFAGLLYCPQGLPCATSEGGTDGFVVRVTASGALDWVQTFGGTSIDQVNAVATDVMGNVAVTGVYSTDAKWGAITLGVANPGDLNFFVAKVGGAGALSWAKGYQGTATQIASGIATTADGDILVTGQTGGTTGEGNVVFGNSTNPAFLFKVSAGGNPIWGKALGTSAGPASGSSVCVDAAGNIALAGTVSGTIDFGAGLITAVGTSDAFLAKLDPNGEYLWAKTFGTKGVAHAGRSVAFTPSGTVLVALHAGGNLDFGLGELTAAGSTDAGAAAFSP